MTTIEGHVAGSTDDAIFDATAYDLPIPRVDGRKADRLTLALAGSLELDRTDQQTLDLLEQLHIGQDVTLSVTATVAAKGFTHTARDDDDQVGFHVRLRIHSYEAPEHP